MARKDYGVTEMPGSRAHSGVHRLAIIGVGMMGGSLAMAALERAGVDEVVGFDTDRNALDEAVARGVITEAARSAQEAAAYADLVVISTPVRSIPALVEECAAAEPRPRLITDTGSTKSSIMQSLSPQAKALFIGGHPMCGGSDSGVKYARADLFVGATYFLCTTGAAFPKLYEMLQQFIFDLGARPTLIDPVAHDRIMAAISHLPHVLANVLMEHVGHLCVGGKRALQFVGASFTDLTRVAGANPPMWRDIFLANREALSESVREIIGLLENYVRLLSGGDESAVTQAIDTAASYKQEMLALADISPETLHKVTVRVPDVPGSISRVMGALSDAGINVEDLTLHHMSRSLGGDLILYVSGQEVAERAAALLSNLGFPARVSLLGDGSE
ncbi:MAG: prephenate dehydrogenase/arogenate dehydrogenase family protein [Thermoleophilia bacterium]|nr:prephenate dehydrogenase/arogenate dehydrogenase family protein [Thermoleophilia bacterium]